jgi:phytoene desaturase
MMPDVFENYFSLFGKKTSDYYNLLALDPHYKIFVKNREYVITDDFEKTKQLFEKTEKGAGVKLQQFLDKSEFLYKGAMEKLVYFDYESLKPLLSPTLLFQIMKMKLFNTYHHEVASYFKHPDLQKILEFMTVFLGGSPFITPAFYTLIAHTDFNLKIWHPEGGIYKVIEALIKLCEEYHVDINTNEEIIKMNFNDRKITSIQTAKDTFKTDIVVMNADYAHAESTLLPKEFQTYSPEFWKKKTLSPSAILYYVGLRTKLKKMAHHCLYFDESWESHFEDVYKDPKRHSWRKGLST